MTTASLAYPLCDCAATRAALRIGAVQNLADDRAVKSLTSALGNEDAVCIIGLTVFRRGKATC
jgi:hypothetical protein